MPAQRLSPMDAAFLEVESPAAHMHIGWAAVCSVPEDGRRPRFDELREHVALRVPRAPRYRKRLAPVPLGINHPEWVDDPYFDIGRHVLRSRAETLSEAVDEAMSEPLPRDRPLWQLHIADRLADGSLGVVGKAHHCMMNGIAAVELASLLLDTEPDAPEPEPDDWEPATPPGAAELLRRAFADRVREQIELARLSARTVTSPSRLLGVPGAMVRGARALADSVRPAAPSNPLNKPISPPRHLALLERPLDDLRAIKRGFGVTINDVVLAVSAASVRRFLEKDGDGSVRLKAMVPVNVRAEDEGELGNRISFMFVDLPCDEAEPERRLECIHRETSARKEFGEPEVADALLRLVAYAPRTLQIAISRLMASPRTFNLVVSNIPGPREPLYLRGCELRCAFPVVPIADRHALSIGFTTVRDRACFGLYAARESLPESDSLAVEIDRELDRLLELVEGESVEPMRDMVMA